MYPATITLVELPNPDLGELREDYQEAADILNRSPRAAAAMMRSVLERLCIQIGGDANKSLAENIKSLIKEHKIHPSMEPMMDTVRLAGNNAIHKDRIATLDDADDSEIASALFGMVNSIVESAITQPRELDKLHASVASPGKGSEKEEVSDDLSEKVIQSSRKGKRRHGHR